ncbi:FecCD family ABC transporter permease [Paenibacillus cymbidii]|uniref:FecCD family ABC transporter permease n=1 Tax=Paenibacillus cymbidii TaxID=1639034 RepID=UPI0010821658|nr:iron ABC transporter permease [Paenibacillus cymbidii]
MRTPLLRFTLLVLLLLAALALAATTGSIRIGLPELTHGLLFGGSDKADIIKDLRLPRIFVSVMTGAALAVSGALLQAVVRNPLADAGVIGISAGASVFALLMIGLFPLLYYWLPLFAFVGGALAWLLVYALSWRSGLSPIRLVLVGIAVNASLTGIGQLLHAMGHSSMTSVNPVTATTFSQMTWDDVKVIVLYGAIGLALAFATSVWCNMLALQDRTARSLGLNVPRARLLVSAVAVLLAAAAASVGGLLAFVGLLVPPVARVAVGSDYKRLLPFAALAGALLVLLADTLGRTLLAPIEIPASVIMTVIGGPVLIFLLRKSERVHGH